jgi:uncharacterized protein (TIGR02145 family)
MIRKAIGFFMMPRKAGVPISGWHFPTNDNLLELCLAVDPDYTYSSNDVGNKLRESGTRHWINSGGINTYGFSLLGAGFRDDSGGFWRLKEHGYISCITEIPGTGIYLGWVDAATPNLYLYDGQGVAGSKTAGYPIRLFKDDSNDPGSLTDIDGNVYPTVKIGNQVIMARNLKVTHFNDGTRIPLVTDNTAWGALATPGRCHFNNNIAYKSVYGELYNWYFMEYGL